MTETRRFLFVGGPADGQRIALQRLGSGALLGPDGAAVSMWPPVHLASVTRWDLLECKNITEEGIYHSRVVMAKLDNEDLIRWTVYTHESIVEPSEQLMTHIVEELWGLL